MICTAASEEAAGLVVVPSSHLQHCPLEQQRRIPAAGIGQSFCTACTEVV